MSDTPENLKNLRSEYKLNKLSEEMLTNNPFLLFKNWFDEVLDKNLPEANSFTLTTATKSGLSSSRVVLLKRFDDSGFVFCTNYKSRKGQELEENPNCSMLFFYPTLERQIRIEGKVKKVSEKDSEDYFYSRPKESQIAAIISDQSSEIPDRKYLEENFNTISKEFENKKVPKPEHWGGYKLIPNYFEFWQGREFRLHDRIAFRLIENTWNIKRLAP